MITIKVWIKVIDFINQFNVYSNFNRHHYFLFYWITVLQFDFFDDKLKYFIIISNYILKWKNFNSKATMYGLNNNLKVKIWLIMINALKI